MEYNTLVEDGSQFFSPNWVSRSRALIFPKDATLHDQTSIAEWRHFITVKIGWILI